MQNPDRVEIDADLSDLVPGFMKRKRSEAETILQAVAAKNYDSIKALAHRIKGEGGSYGFDAITDMGRGLEAALKARDDAELSAIASKLIGYLDRVQVEYVSSDASPDGRAQAPK